MYSFTYKKAICSILKVSALSWILVLISSNDFAQITGCKDPLATNYNATATVNDGSCTYNSQAYTPPIKVDPLDDMISETSGLQMAGGFLWTFNDSGGEAALFKIDTLTKTILQKVYLEGAVNIDWEALAFDGTYFYVGDIGNNYDGGRNDLKIYKFPFIAISNAIANPVITIPANQISVINFYYSDQSQPPVTTSNNNTKFDCEAMFVEGGKINLFTKNWIDLNTTHYVINNTNAGNYVAIPLETLATNFLVTDVDKAKGQNLFVLLGYKNVVPGNHYLYLLSDYFGGKYFNGNKRIINLPDATIMGQAEGLCFKNSTEGYISNEKFVRSSQGFTLTVNQKLRTFNLKDFVSTSTTTYAFTGNGNWDLPSNWSNSMVPPATLNAGSEIIINPAAGGNCILNIVYTVSKGAKLTVNTGKNFVVAGNLIIQ